jgi:hypothetical protein
MTTPEPRRRRKRLTTEDAVRQLDTIDGDGDCEAAHADADDILLATVPAEVAAAYNRLVARTRWWVHA